MPQGAGAGNDPRLLLLDPRDTVLVVTSRIRAVEEEALAGATLTAAGDLPLGHKIARRPIAAGDKVLKYGAPIGTATAPIAAGAHAHVHNIQSDYTPTYHLGAAKARHEGTT